MQEEKKSSQHTSQTEHTDSRPQYLCMAAALLVCLLGFFLICLLKPSKNYSDTERRKLAQFPEFSIETIQKGNFMTDFEIYALDQFPMRDTFRNLKGWISERLLGRKDNNGLYVTDGYAVKMEYPLNPDSINYAAKRFQAVTDQYLKESEGRIFLSIIPDKNYFLAESTGHLKMDYEALSEQLQSGMPYAQYIDIFDLLSAEDYYATDIHWRQEMLVDVAEYLGDRMGVEIDSGYEVQTLDQDFYGVYTSQSAVPLKGEKLHYLTNDVLDQCVVQDYENGKTLGIYDMEKAAGKDPYEIYLSGPISLLTIENPAFGEERELIVFRDSFGSSLIPLLAEGYSRITLIDIRYIRSGLLGNFVDFHGQDVLFLYSTSVLNHSETLK